MCDVRMWAKGRGQFLDSGMAVGTADCEVTRIVLTALTECPRVVGQQGADGPGDAQCSRGQLRLGCLPPAEPCQLDSDVRSRQHARSACRNQESETCQKRQHQRGLETEP